MDSRLQELWDHHEIRNLLAEYCHGCDRMDFERMAGVYARESWDDHGHRGGPGRQYSLETLREMVETKASCSHLLGQSQIRVTGDEAGAETHFLAIVCYPTDSGGTIVNQLGGRYVDRLVREDGRWKVRDRITLRDWSITLPVTEDWIAMQGLKPGKTSGEDPSFAVLGLQHSGSV